MGSQLTERAAALRKAINTHSKTTLDAMMGKGVDRHLFALRKMHERVTPGKPLPDIFTDKGTTWCQQKFECGGRVADEGRENSKLWPVRPQPTS